MSQSHEGYIETMGERCGHGCGWAGDKNNDPYVTGLPVVQSGAGKAVDLPESSGSASGQRLDIVE